MPGSSKATRSLGPETCSPAEIKSTLGIYIQALKDRIFPWQLVDNPRREVETVLVEKTVGGTTITWERTETRDELQIILLINQPSFGTVVNAGLIENSFGFGVEHLFGNRDQFRLGMEIQDTNNHMGPHLKITAYWQFFSSVFMVAGEDGLIGGNADPLNTVLGIGLRFNEDSLKPSAAKPTMPRTGCRGRRISKTSEFRP